MPVFGLHHAIKMKDILDADDIDEALNAAVLLDDSLKTGNWQVMPDALRMAHLHNGIIGLRKAMRQAHKAGCIHLMPLTCNKSW